MNCCIASIAAWMAPTAAGGALRIEFPLPTYPASQATPMPTSNGTVSRVSRAEIPIEEVIHTVRGERVLLDADLARIYGVDMRVCNQAVRRNRAKFPSDFPMDFTSAEAVILQQSRKLHDTRLRSQSVIIKRRQHLTHRPFAFTEHGALMAANGLNSAKIAQMSVLVIRAFVKMRGLLTDTRELAKKLAALEQELKARLDSHETAIVDVLQRIMKRLDPHDSPEPPSKEMGDHTGASKR